MVNTAKNAVDIINDRLYNINIDMKRIAALRKAIDPKVTGI